MEEEPILDNMPIYQGFQAIEALQHASESAGWDCEYRQIERGSLSAQATIQQFSEMTLIRESANKQIEVSATAPKDSFVLLACISQNGIDVNNHHLNDKSLFLFYPGSELYVVSPAGATIVDIHIPKESFTRNIYELTGQSNNAVASSTIPIYVPREGLARLRGYLDKATSHQYQSVSDALDEHALSSRLISLIEQASTNTVKADRYHRLKKRQLLMRCIDYIETHLSHSIRINDLCTCSGLTERTLERLFLREIQVTPSRYIQARRLDRVRRELLTPDRNEPVYKIAEKYGFNHMGRFSSLYRAHFGAYPSTER